MRGGGGSIRVASSGTGGRHVILAVCLLHRLEVAGRKEHQAEAVLGRPCVDLELVGRTVVNGDRGRPAVRLSTSGRAPRRAIDPLRPRSSLARSRAARLYGIWERWDAMRASSRQPRSAVAGVAQPGELGSTRYPWWRTTWPATAHCPARSTSGRAAARARLHPGPSARIPASGPDLESCATPGTARLTRARVATGHGSLRVPGQGALKRVGIPVRRDGSRRGRRGGGRGRGARRAGGRQGPGAHRRAGQGGRIGSPTTPTTRTRRPSRSSASTSAATSSARSGSSARRRSRRSTTSRSRSTAVRRSRSGMFTTQGGIDIEEVAEKTPGRAREAARRPARGLPALAGAAARPRSRRRRPGRAEADRGDRRRSSTTPSSATTRCSARSTR